MKPLSLLAVAGIAALTAATGVHADEYYESHLPPENQSVRSRADVRAEAVQVARNRNPNPAGSQVIEPIKNPVDRQTVRNQLLRRPPPQPLA